MKKLGTRTPGTLGDVVRIYAAPRIPDRDDRDAVRRTLKAVSYLVATTAGFRVPGLGVFEWKPFRGHTPHGKDFMTERIWFRSAHLKAERQRFFESSRSDPGAMRRDGKEVSNMAKSTKKPGKGGGCKKGGCCK